MIFAEPVLIKQYALYFKNDQNDKCAVAKRTITNSDKECFWESEVNLDLEILSV